MIMNYKFTIHFYLSLFNCKWGGGDIMFSLLTQNEVVLYGRYCNASKCLVTQVKSVFLVRLKLKVELEKILNPSTIDLKEQNIFDEFRFY